MPRRSNRRSRRGGRGRGVRGIGFILYSVDGKIPAAGTINVLASQVPGFEIGRPCQIKWATTEILSVSDAGSSAFQLTARCPDLGASPPSRDVARSVPHLAAPGAVNRFNLRVKNYGDVDYQASDALFRVDGPANAKFNINFTVSYSGPVLGAGISMNCTQEPEMKTPVDKLCKKDFEMLSDADFVDQLLDEEGYVSVDHLMESFRSMQASLAADSDDEVNCMGR